MHTDSSSTAHHRQFQLFNQRDNRYKHIKMAYSLTSKLSISPQLYPPPSPRATSLQPISDFCDGRLNPMPSQCSVYWDSTQTSSPKITADYYSHLTPGFSSTHQPTNLWNPPHPPMALPPSYKPS
jgi:hypothetical protein